MWIIKDYLGVSIQEKKRLTTLTQPQLIDEILRDVGFRENLKPVLIIAMPTNILYRFLKEPPQNKQMFYFWLVVGKVNYLEKTSSQDIAYAVHQCACFVSNPQQSHAYTQLCIWPNTWKVQRKWVSLYGPIKIRVSLYTLVLIGAVTGQSMKRRMMKLLQSPDQDMLIASLDV